MVKNIVLAAPRGFCAGVVRAIDVVERALEKYGSPVYVRHEIVHNQKVVNELKKKGAVFVEKTSEIPRGAVGIFSAHGVPLAVVSEAQERGVRSIDATCPLVKKVHLEAQRFHREGYEIILIGHNGHQEVLGTMGYAPMTLVGSVEDAEKLLIDSEKVAYLTQTTLSVSETLEIITALKKKFPKIEGPSKEDICYATTNRQVAVKDIARTVDLFLVVGATNSSNSNRLVETAKSSGVVSYLVQDVSYLQKNWFERVERVGVSSGASVPEELVKEVLEQLRNWFEDVIVETVTTAEENVRFGLPVI